MEIFFYRPIGIVKSNYNSKISMPIQPSSAENSKGVIEIDPEYINGLIDLDGFSHIIVIYHFHESEGFNLITKPFLDDKTHGVFATRAPKRPNNIGLSVLKLNKIVQNKLFVENVDILNQTPVLDIKPYIPQFNNADDVTIGWIEKSKEQIKSKKSDKRFS